MKFCRIGHGGLLCFNKKGFAGERRCAYGGVMLVLGLDTALQRCSVAIIRGDEVLADESVGMERGHAERLAPMAAAALAKAGVSIGDLSRVGVVVGPGGFTGVRVALSFARGLGVGTGIPVVGVTSLAALAAPHWAQELVAPVIDARRGQVYAALYGRGGEIILPPFVSEPKEALKKLQDKAADRSVRVLGSGARLLGPAPAGWSVSEAREEIDARIVALLAAKAPAPDGPPAPLYLRAPDAKPGKPGLFDGAAR
ncbi:tRNA (adenosine(37)-N6)-threonylcarbamoyltransferase complex dimerization subunit type 1 TsaB [Marinicaulis aureus]|uniref:tRNA (Adenosine(37)-N6)-threonylcarbamoyltransferase complex dimerization subunit type 1 TsaB n=1 Tax=Hyphococcus aureus TaxID=2666033 RepID=A0ABW1KX43_9PROT